MASLLQNFHKLQRYLDITGLVPPEESPISPGEHARAVARKIRGENRPPALFLIGITKRSGTVHLGDMLEMHPEVAYYPNKIWEIPFLEASPALDTFWQRFLWLYQDNREKIGGQDYAPLFGAAFLRYLHEYVPPDKRMLLKNPGVAFLNRFYDYFPHEHLLILVRDGRDVVESTRKTWKIPFVAACRRWKWSARTVLAFHAQHKHRQTGYALVRFEDVITAPQATIQDICQRYGLSAEMYPYERIAKLPIQGSSQMRDHTGKVAYWVKRESKSDFSPIGRWHTWKLWEVALFKAICGQELIALQYAADMRWKTP
ncbi:MAG: hypothetical protein D6681_20940 [Calditrichaeota bacterium]|nr:MAG: hypothetical protein D6681_20940 [Calditrichota bacterium]